MSKYLKGICWLCSEKWFLLQYFSVKCAVLKAIFTKMGRILWAWIGLLPWCFGMCPRSMIFYIRRKLCCILNGLSPWNGFKGELHLRDIAKQSLRSPLQRLVQFYDPSGSDTKISGQGPEKVLIKIGGQKQDFWLLNILFWAPRLKI